MSISVKSLAQLHNLTIADIARQAKLPYSLVRRLYNGQAKRPHRAHVIALAHVLGVSPDSLPFKTHHDAQRYTVNWSMQPSFHFNPFTTLSGAHLGILGARHPGKTRVLRYWAKQVYAQGAQVVVLDMFAPQNWSHEARIHTLSDLHRLELDPDGWTVTTCIPSTIISASAALQNLYTTLIERYSNTNRPYILIIENVDALVESDPTLLPVLASMLPTWQKHDIHVWWSATPDILAYTCWRDVWQALPGRALVGPDVDLAVIAGHLPRLTTANLRMLNQNTQCNLLLHWRDAEVLGWHVGTVAASYPHFEGA